MTANRREPRRPCRTVSATNSFVTQGKTSNNWHRWEGHLGNPLVTGSRIRPLAHRRNGLNPRIMLWASMIARALVSSLARRLRRRLNPHSSAPQCEAPCGRCCRRRSRSRRGRSHRQPRSTAGGSARGSCSPASSGRRHGDLTVPPWHLFVGIPVGTRGGFEQQHCVSLCRQRRRSVVR
jgi:hypothetical protein